MTASMHHERPTAAHPASAYDAAIDITGVAALSDPLGVLSIYVDADPTLARGPRPAWQAPVRAGLRRLVNEARRERPHAEWMALEARLAELEPELEVLLDSRLGHRGRVLFATVAGRELRRVELPVPVAPLVVLERQACVVPLLRAAQDGKPAGVATVSWDRLEPAEWQFDHLHALDPVALADKGKDERQRRRATNPAVPQPFPERDTFESAAGTRVLARLREAGGRLRQQATARGWDVVVVDGDPRLVEVLSGSIGHGPFELVRSSRPLAGLPDAVAAERVGALVREQRLGRQTELLRALDASPASTRDPQVLERSVDQGRVQHLLLEAPSEGAWSPLAESLLRRALQTGAEVTPVPLGAGDLGPAGAAALLRW
jgi:hypothetical protein